jgi:hypothetical protein
MSPYFSAEASACPTPARPRNSTKSALSLADLLNACARMDSTIVPNCSRVGTRNSLCQCLDHVHVWQQLGWNVVPFLKMGSTVVGDPDFSLSIFPNQNFEWKIDRTAGRGQHHRRACFRVPENQQLGRSHSHSRFYRFSVVINNREQRNSLRLQNRFELLDRFVAKSSNLLSRRRE